MTDILRYMKTKEAASFLSFSVDTLNNWRSQGRGPVYKKIGASVRYRLSDLEVWANAGEASRREFEREAECHQERLGRVKRLRGRSGQTQRVRRLAAEPLCRDCLRIDGIERKSEEVDHIIPLAYGGSDEDDNIRCLCKPCHSARTRPQVPDAEADWRSPSERL